MSVLKIQFQKVPISEVKPNQFYDIAGDGKFAIFPVRIYTDLIPGKIVVSSIDYKVHVYEPDTEVHVFTKRK